MASNRTRLESIDQFRGLAILLMVLANFLADKAVVPAGLKHAPDVGLTVIDLIAPFFMFAIGLTYGPSFRARAANGAEARPGVVGHFVKRFLGFIGIGAVISAGETALGFGSTTWGVLQAIGAAGLLTLPTLAVPPRWRALMGCALLAGYQVVLDLAWLPVVLASSHGGINAVPAWSAMLMISTAIADDGLPDGRPAWRLPIWSACALIGGITLAILLPGLVPVSKNRVSAAYVLVSTGASGLLFALFRLLVDRLGGRIPFLSGWGKNPLLLYGLHYALLGLLVLPGAAWWHADATALLVAVQAILLVGILGAIARALDRRGVVLSL